MERSTTGRNSKLQKRKNCLEILNELCAKTGLSHTWEESVAVETNSGKGPPFFFQQLTVTGNDNITEAELERVFKSKDPKRSKKDAQKASAELAVEWLRELSKQGSISVNWSEWNNEEDVQSRDEMRAAADQQHQEGSPLDPSSVGPLDHGMAGMATRSPVSMLKEMEDMTNKLTVNWGEARCESTISGKQDFYQPVTIALFSDDGSSKREEEEIKATTPQSTKKAAKRATAEEALKWLNARGLNLFALKSNDDDDDDYGGVTPPNPIAPWLQGDDNKIRDGQNAEPREIQGTTQNGSSLDSALRGLSLGQPMPLLHGPASSTTYPEPTPKTATIPLPARDPTIEPAPSAPSSNRSTPHSEAAAVQPNDVTLATSLQVTPLANNLSDPGEPGADDHLEARGAGESTLFSPPDAETEASTDPSLKIVVGVGEVKELESDGGNVEPGLVLHKDPQESNNHGETSSSAVLVDVTCFSSALPEGVSAEFLDKPEMRNKQVVAVGGPAGDSLFAAVAAQLAQYAASIDSQGVWAGPHALRQDTAEHLRRNRDRFAQRFGEATKSSKSLFDQYIKQMSQDGYAGGSIEIAAMEEMLDYSFDIFLDKSECFDSFFTEEDQDDSMNNDATNDDSSTVQLSFHCNDRYHRVQCMQPDEVHSKEKLLPKRQTRHIQRNRGDQCLGHIECGNCHQIILAGDQLCLFKGSNLVTKLEHFEEHPSSYRTAPHPKSSSSE